MASICVDFVMEGEDEPFAERVHMSAVPRQGESLMLSRWTGEGEDVETQGTYWVKNVEWAIRMFPDTNRASEMGCPTVTLTENRPRD